MRLGGESNGVVRFDTRCEGMPAALVIATFFRPRGTGQRVTGVGESLTG